jgi:hypothetical protein
MAADKGTKCAREFSPLSATSISGSGSWRWPGDFTPAVWNTIQAKQKCWQRKRSLLSGEQEPFCGREYVLFENKVGVTDHAVLAFTTVFNHFCAQ